MTAPAPDCKECPTYELCEWNSLSDAELEVLEYSKKYVEYRRGEIVYSENDDARGMYCLRTGSLALVKTDSDGNTAVIRMANAGETLGYRSFFAGDVHSTSAEAITPCQICYIPGHVLTKLVANNGQLGLSFLTHAARDMREVGETYLRISTAPVRTRLTYYLKTISDLHGDQVNGSFQIKLPLRRSDIANVIGTTPESLSRAIRKISDEGLATFDDQMVIISDSAVFFSEFAEH